MKREAYVQPSEGFGVDSSGLLHQNLRHMPGRTRIFVVR